MFAVVSFDDNNQNLQKSSHVFLCSNGFRDINLSHFVPVNEDKVVKYNFCNVALR